MYYNSKSYNKQYLLQPIVLTFEGSEEREIISQNWKHLADFGFEAEFSGDDKLYVKVVPTFAYRKVVPSLIRKIKEILLNIRDFRRTEKEFIRLIACRSAIKAKRKLRKMEMYYLIHQLASLKNPWECPHGRPTIKQYYLKTHRTIDQVSKKEIDKEFDRN